jgi:hypothetical protein
LGISFLALSVFLSSCDRGHLANQSSETTSSSSSVASHPAPSAKWTSTSVPPGVGSLNDVTCPSPTRCYAVGGMAYLSGSGWIIASSNGGDTWTLLDSVPQSWFSAIACSTITSCVAVGGSTGQGNASQVPLVVVTADGGQRWSSSTLPAEIGPASDVACASSTVCVAVGSTVARTADGGASWTPGSSPAGLADIASVTCPTTVFCIIGGAGPGPGSSSPSMSSVSHDGGLSWSAATIAAGPAGLGEISCADAQHCVGLVGSDATDTAGTGSPLVSSDGGKTWTRVPYGVGDAVSCVGTFCVSVGALWQSASNTFPGDAFVSDDGGLHWTAMAITTPELLNAVACTSSTRCVAVGGNLQNGSDGAILTYSTH